MIQIFIVLFFVVSFWGARYFILAMILYGLIF